MNMQAMHSNPQLLPFYYIYYNLCLLLQIHIVHCFTSLFGIEVCPITILYHRFNLDQLQICIPIKTTSKSQPKVHLLNQMSS